MGVGIFGLYFFDRSVLLTFQRKRIFIAKLDTACTKLRKKLGAHVRDNFRTSCILIRRTVPHDNLHDKLCHCLVNYVFSDARLV